MDCLIRDCILCPITITFYKKDEKKNDFFLFISFFTLIHLRDKPLWLK